MSWVYLTMTVAEESRPEAVAVAQQIATKMGLGNYPGLDGMLDTQGKNGYELVSMVPYKWDDQGVLLYRAVFKKQTA